MAYIRTIVRIIACCVLFGGCALLQPYGQSDTVQRIENVEYSQIHTRNRMDLFLPVGQDQYPTVVFVHGGWWRNQSKTYWRPFTGLYWNVGLALARQGIATAVIDYRIYPEGQIREQLNDVRRSIAWVQHNIHAYGGNPQAVFVAGHSAGGHLALLAGCDPDSDLRGVIALSPVLDLEYLFAHESAEFQDEVLYPVFGTDRERWRAYDPVQKLNSACAPIQIMVGSQDYPVIQAPARALEFGSTNANSGESIVWIPDRTHEDMVLDIYTEDDPITDSMVAFIRSHNSTPQTRP